MVRSVAPLVGLVALSACADGTVKGSAVDFGRVKSATWLERKLIDPAGDEHRHDFVLATAPNWCKFANRVYPDLGAAWADVLDVITENPSDSGAQCEAKKAFYTTAADATDDAFKNGLSVLHLALRDPNEAADLKPFTGPYEAVGFNEIDRYIVAGIQQYDTNPYRVYADEADCENNATFFESDARDKVEKSSDEFTLADGTGEADAPTSKSYKIRIEGTLDDRSGAAAGDVTIKGTFDYCDLTWEGDFPEFL